MLIYWRVLYGPRMDNDPFDIIQYETKCGKHTHQQFPFAGAYNTETVQLAFSDCFGFPIAFESSVDIQFPTFGIGSGENWPGDLGQDSVRSFPKKNKSRHMGIS